MMPLAPYPPHSFSAYARWCKQLAALVRKEFKQIVRDPSSYLVAVILPMIFLLLFGYGITLDAGVMHIAVLDESGTPASSAISAEFAHSPNFTVRPVLSRAHAAQLMRDSEIAGLVVFPSNFDTLLTMEGRHESVSPVQVIVSGAEPNTASFIQAYSQGVIDTWQSTRAGTLLRRPIALEPRIWFNPAAMSRWFLVPGSITVVMTLIGTMLTALVIAREWERGTMESLYASPVTRMQILLGKLIPYYCMGMCSMSLCALAGVYLFEVPFHGSIFALFVLSTAFLIPALGQGLFISILTKEQLLAAQAGLLTAFLPAVILSGFIFDINSMPRVLQIITFVVPARHFNVSLQTVFLAGDIWAVFVPGMAYMLGLGLVLLTLTYRRLIKRLDA
ncbi:MAG: ABC transporter permease subunit [Desulfovibrionaceae bacterium]